LQDSFPVLRGHHALTSATLSDDGSLLVVNDVNGWVQCWQIPSWKLVLDKLPHSYTQIPWTNVTPDRTRIVACSLGTVSIVRIADGALVGEINNLKNLRASAISHDGRYLALGRGTGEIEIRDLSTLKLLHRLDTLPVALRSMKFVDHDKRLVACGAAGTLDFFDTSDWHEITTLAPDRNLSSPLIMTGSSVAYNEPSDLLAAYFADGRLRIWRGSN